MTPRPERLAALFGGLFLLGCATPDTATSPSVRDAWFGPAAPIEAAGPFSLTAIDLYETSQGLAGRARLAGGGVYPLRNIQRSQTHLSFLVTASDPMTALDATFNGERNAVGWTGAWDTQKAILNLTLAPIKAPDEHDLKMVALGDGRRMHLVCLGEGSPTVVFDAGAGGNTGDWRLVHAEIAKTTRACAYDRAGMGLSDPAAPPRDAAATSRDIEAMLTAAGVKGPYVMVGHSLGSYHVRQFANTHARDVVGMVLVDPSGDFQVDRMAAAAPHFAAIANPDAQVKLLKDCAAKARSQTLLHGSPDFAACSGNEAARFETVASEIETMMRLSSPELVASRRSYGAMPLIVLTRGDFTRGTPKEATPEDMAAVQTVWRAMPMKRCGRS